MIFFQDILCEHAKSNIPFSIHIMRHESKKQSTPLSPSSSSKVISASVTLSTSAAQSKNSKSSLRGVITVSPKQSFGSRSSPVTPKASFGSRVASSTSKGSSGARSFPVSPRVPSVSRITAFYGKASSGSRTSPATPKASGFSKSRTVPVSRKTSPQTSPKAGF